MNNSRPSRRSEDRKSVYVIAAIFVIILISYAIMVFSSQRLAYQCQWEDPVDYLNVRVETTSDIEYEVYLPIPVDAPNQTWYLVDFLNLTRGNAKWSVVSTSYGMALRVEAKGNITMRAEAATSKGSYAGFSLSKYEWAGPELTGPYLIYVNASGLESNLRQIYIGAGTSTPYGTPRLTVAQSFPGEIRQGWQEITGGTSDPVC